MASINRANNTTWNKYSLATNNKSYEKWLIPDPPASYFDFSRREPMSYSVTGGSQFRPQIPTLDNLSNRTDFYYNAETGNIYIEDSNGEKIQLYQYGEPPSTDIIEEIEDKEYKPIPKSAFSIR